MSPLPVRHCAGSLGCLFADSDNRRLYVSHNAEVVVIDLDSSVVPETFKVLILKQP